MIELIKKNVIGMLFVIYINEMDTIKSREIQQSVFKRLLFSLYAYENSMVQWEKEYKEILIKKR